MSLSKKLSISQLWFWIGIIAVFLVSITLRFWRLGQFNILVFDEAYYAKFGINYLTHTPFFDAHPPLGKYIIAIGIWLGERMPFGRDTVNYLTGSRLSTFSYRWINALTGAFIPVIVGGIAYQLSNRRSYALIAALFAATDGLLLVETRYALINPYIVLFGLLGQWLFLIALAFQGKRRWVWLAIAGICFGASISVKWNGLWFLSTIYLVWAAAWVLRWLRNRRATRVSRNDESILNNQPLIFNQTSLHNLTRLNLLHIIVFLGIIPIVVYCLIWIPHLQINSIGLWDIQKQILDYHKRLGGNNIHPYCSPWYTWLLMLRPVAYFYHTARNTNELVPAFPPLPNGAGKLVYDVHGMGNPILVWLSTAAIVIVLLLVTKRLLSGEGWMKNPPSNSTWTLLYIVLGYAANLVPWMPINRCTFFYHYMEAAIFAQLGLAWIVDTWLNHKQVQFRVIGVTISCLILLGFVYWLPVFLGIPLSPEGFKHRMLLNSWI